MLFMRSLAGTEDNDEIVLTAIERTLTSIRLDPHDDVQRFAISQSAGLHDFSHVPPVAAHEVNGATSRDPGGIAQCAFQELDIFQRSHLA